MKRPPAAPRLRVSSLRGAARRESWATLRGNNRLRYTFNGRGAIYQYLVALRSATGSTDRKLVLLPAFHCPTVVDPVLHAGYEVRFYEIDRQLRVVAQDVLDKLDRQVAAVVFIRYFGFAEMDSPLVSACLAAGARIIEDSSHSFLSANPLRLAYSGADATTYSFWKLIPSLAGGGVLLPPGSDDHGWPEQSTPSARDSWSRIRTLAGELLEQPLDVVHRPASKAKDAPTPAVRKPAAQAYPYEAAAARWRMPPTAKLILARANLGHIVAARRRNFMALASTLIRTKDIWPLRDSLPADTCPWGFPVLLSKRSERDYLLRASGVPLFTFGEVLHPLLFTQRQPSMIGSAEYLSETLLAFAIHQDLDEAVVRRYGQIINDFAARL